MPIDRSNLRTQYSQRAPYTTPRVSISPQQFQQTISELQKSTQQIEAAEKLMLRQHFGRMIHTAGHSWGWGEHDQLVAALRQRRSRPTLYSTFEQVREFASQRLHSFIVNLPLPAQQGLRALRHPNLAGPAAMLMLLSLLIPVFNAQASAAGYDLDKAQALLGKTSADLTSKLTYDSSQQSYVFNKDASSELPGSTATSTTVGGLTYSANLPLNLNPSTNLTLTDAQSKNTISLSPQFMVNQAKAEGGRVVYPLISNNAQLVYTPEQAGLKEDIILYNAPGDSASFSYKLQLPDGMVARIQKDGSIGIFGGDSTLFGNVSASDAKDQALLATARTHAKKDHLYYAIPAPVITGDSQAKAHFSLSGDTLTVIATGLADAHYPLSIDPSFIMNTTNCGLGQMTNDDGNGSISSCSLSRSTLTGGAVTSWTQQNTGASGYNGSNGARSAGITAYNGFLYAAGGSYSNNTAVLNSVSYAAINSNGTIGSWTVNGTTFTTGRQKAGVVAYNGFLYVYGGADTSVTSFSDVQYAQICTGQNSGVGGCTSSAGSLGTWHSTTSFTNHDSVVGRALFGAGAYNGYLYMVGGANINGGSINYYNTIEYALIKADGTIGAWTEDLTHTLPAPQTTASVFYNGRIYAAANCLVGTGNCSSATTAISYTSLNSDGTINSWTTGSSFATARTLNSMTVANGYLYLAAGYNGTSTYYSDVQYAPIYTSGGLGKWSTTASITTNRAAFGFTSYNGYLYLLGGQTSGADASDTQYATVTTPGDTTAYTTGLNAYNSGGNSSTRAGEAVVAYNGYVYVIGGRTAGGSTVTNTINYASLNTDGTVGTWANADTTGGFTTARWQLQAVAANGYLYIMGGANSNLSSYFNDIQYVPVASNGTLGSWTTNATHIPDVTNTGRAKFGAAVYNNYLYVLGGVNNSNGTVVNDIQYGQLNASTGAVTWQSSSLTLPTNRMSMAVVATAGYIYIFGGMSSPASGIVTDDTYYASISNSTGSLGSWTAGSSFANGEHRFAAGAAVSNGYVYLVGGSTQTVATAGLLADVQYASINPSNGSLGSWAVSANSIPSARINPGTIISDGYLYNVGGCDKLNTADCTLLNVDYLVDVSSAAINNGGGGAPTSWSSETNTFTTGREGLASVAYNGYLYVLGGYDGTTYYSDVQYAAISGNGTLGSWASAGTGFTTARYNFGAVVYNGYLYIAGGQSASNLLSDVQYAKLSSNGTLASNAGCGSTWCSGTGLSQPISQFSLVASNGYLYAVGGNAATSQTFSYTGGSQSWTVPAGVTTVTIETWGAQGGSINASGIGGLGGYASGTITTTPGQSLDVEVGGKGADGSTGNVAGAGGYNGGGNGATGNATYGGTGGGGASDVRQGGSALANRVVVAGGGGGGELNSTDFGGTGGGTNGGAGGDATTGGGGTQSAGGTAGAPGGPGNAGNPGVLGVGGAGVAGVFLNGSSGGGGGYYGGGSGASATIVGAGGGGSGLVPATDPSASMVNGVQSGNGKVVISYVTTANYSNGVNSAPINSNGSIGTWSDANNGGSSFSTGRAYPGAVVYGNYLYVAGGFDGTNYRSDVQYAQLTGGGLLGSWNTTSSFMNPHTAQPVLAANGYLYVVGGKNGTTNFNDIQAAPFLSNGQIGQWSVYSSSWTARSNAASATYNGYLFELGGNDGTATRRSDTQYAPLQSMSRIAHYSLALTTDTNTTPANFFLTDSAEAVGNNISVGYELATNAAPTFSGLTTQSNLASGSKYSLGTPGTPDRYYYLYITIDDSQAATFGETSGTSISYLKVNYHPANTMRLRGGMTFNANSLQSLDAP